MMYRISEPRMLIWSSEICEPPFGVIFAVRSDVFICGETEAMVPWTIVPTPVISFAHRSYVIRGDRESLPVLSSMVTDSLVHFIKNLPCLSARLVPSQPLMILFSTRHARFGLGGDGLAYLTSFMIAASRTRVRASLHKIECFRVCMASCSRRVGV